MSESNRSDALGDSDGADSVELEQLRREASLLREQLQAVAGGQRGSQEVQQLEARIDSLAARNTKLMDTLKDARQQLLALREEVDRLGQPPSGYGVLLDVQEDDTVDVFTSGRKMRLTCSPNIDTKVLKKGQTVRLNEALTVVEAGSFEAVGEISTLRELLADGRRAMVVGHADEERIVWLAEPLVAAEDMAPEVAAALDDDLKPRKLRPGDSLLVDSKAGYAFERIPKAEVEDLVLEEVPDVGYGDIGGLTRQIEQIRDAVELPFLHKELYREYSLRPPKGVLLYGPPGTGKTLLARAVAGEAGVPFFTISGSDFVEMFVGVGASRVRDLFEQAKQNAPSIIFVDEIDAVGRQRGAGLGGGHDEREQTLNQLLVEMDGFGERQGVILIAATNRPDILDPALLRPGRFDRQIPVSSPDLAGRKAVLRVHSQGKPLAPGADLDGLAKRTVGMSGADLANVINEAALLTARENGTVITGAALEEAVDRVIGGPRRKGRVISETEKKITAYHEGGHTLAAWAMTDIEPIYKVTILARGRTGGHAVSVPEDDKGLMTRSEMIARLVFAMGGRAAEELVFREPTTGAVSDIEQATKIARAMVTEYGMSSKLGAVRYGTEHGDPFLGRTMGTQADYSHEVARDIDDEVRKLIEAAHDEAWAILTEHRDVLDVLAAELLEKETLHRAELEVIFAGIQKRPRLSVFDDFGGRIPSDKPPIKTPGELAIERGEPWPQPVPEPAFKKAIAAASAVHAQQGHDSNGNGSQQPGRHHVQNGPTQPNYGAPSGWQAPGWPPPQQQQQGYWYPPPPAWGTPHQQGQPPPQQQPHPTPTHTRPGSAPQDESGQDPTYRPKAE